MTSTTEYRNIVYRLIPGTTTKAQKLAAQAGACRFVWNTLLGRTQTAYAEAQVKGDDVAKGEDEDKKDGDKGEKPPSVSFFSLGKNFTALRREVPWLGDYSYAITRYVLKYQADAWVQAFKGGGYPRFKKRGTSIPSFTIPENVRIKENKLYIPRLGWYRLQRKGGNPWVGGMGPDGTPVKAVIRKISADRWHVTICYKVEVPPMPDNGVIAGIDMNVGQVAVVTNRGQDNNHQDAPLAYRAAEDNWVGGKNQASAKSPGPQEEGVQPPAEDARTLYAADEEASEQAQELAASYVPTDQSAGQYGCC